MDQKRKIKFKSSNFQSGNKADDRPLFV